MPESRKVISHHTTDCSSNPLNRLSHFPYKKGVKLSLRAQRAQMTQPLDRHRDIFSQQRKRIAKKLQNPRLQRITFHTFRHWKATMEYHRTKDNLYVKQVLGHKRIENTLIYVQLAEELFKDQIEYISQSCQNRRRSLLTSRSRIRLCMRLQRKQALQEEKELTSPRLISLA